MKKKDQILDPPKESPNLVEMTRRLELAEKKLTAEKTFSNFLIQESTAAIVIMDTDFTILDVNEAYLKTVNKSKEEVIGASCYQISHGINVPCSSAFPGVKCPMVETLRTGENVHVIHDHKGPNGKPVYCNLNTYPVKDESGKVVEVIEFWRDITDEFSDRWDKQVRKFNSNIQKLVQEDRMISLGKLAASCAHEINNPIQGMLTFSHYMMEILKESRPSAERLAEFQGHLSMMAAELERCGNIVSGLLSFSRESSVEYKQADLYEIIQSVLSLTRHKLQLGNIRLTTDLDPGPLMMEGDINQLQQCFLNLIFNAIEAMPEEGDLTVILKADPDQGRAMIEIRDTGFGIPEKSRDRLFDPFFTTKPPGQGTGLGLSIVYGVVKNHKGTITIDTRVGEGTAFTLKFPLL